MFRSKRITLILRSKETGKKIEKIKFSKQESSEIRTMAQTIGLSEKQLLEDALESILKELKFKKSI